MLSKVAKFNDASLGDIGGRSSVHGMSMASYGIDTIDMLEDAFSEEELYLIESAFEGWHRDFGSVLRFHNDHSYPSNRLIAICQNIIDHGEFKPSVRYDIIRYEI